MTRADDLRKMLNNARNPGESFKAYRRRRKLAQISVEKELKGRVFYAPQFDKHGKGVPYVKEA